MRVGALQDWPLLLKQPSTSRVTAFWKSASSSRMFADLPPSSWQTRLTVSAALFATWMPARVEPVNETMSTSGCAASALPTPGPSPLTRLNTPGGTPASCSTWANSNASSGAISLGFSTMVQPVASAGATLQPIWFAGQFHGVMNAHTPTGSRNTRVVPMFSSKRNSFSTCSAALKCPTIMAACALVASVIGAPISCEIAAANSP